ncbi:MAG: hypothetical protein ACRET7_06565 [Burkholderiales bacterium]
MVRWINTPCTDPVGRVFIAGGRVYRAIFPGQENLARSIIDNREVRALMDDGLIARMWVADYRVNGCELVVEAEKAPFDVPCERFTRATLRAAALCWLEVCTRLLPAELALSDAHYGNYMLFGANEPRWVDLGSIRPPSAVGKEQPFRSFQRFWSGMLAPLTLLETQPRHTRLARLAIADQPCHGPLTTADEAPLSVDEPVKDFLKQLHSEVKALGAEQALGRLSAFITQLPAKVEADTAGDKEPAAAVLQELERQFSADRISSVICLGSDAFRQFSRSWGKADALVIDEIEGNLDGLARTLKRSDGGGQTALYFVHPVNRAFLKSPPAADAALAIDPLARYTHNSHVEAENLAHILGTLGGKLAVVVTKATRKARTEQMLRHEFPSVTTLAHSWLGIGPVVVVGRK